MLVATVGSVDDDHSNIDVMLNIGTALAALQVLDPGCVFDEWLKIGMALHSVSPTLLREWDSWSRGSDNYQQGECADNWAAFSPEDGITLQTLCDLADATRKNWRAPKSRIPGAHRSLRTHNSHNQGSCGNSVDCGNSVYGSRAWPVAIPLSSVSVDPFPVESIPGPFGAFIEQLAEFTQTPTDLAAGMFLAAAAICLQGKFVVRVRRGWTEPLNLYVMSVLEPANRKSAVVSAIASPIRRFEANETERLTPVIREAKANWEIKAKQRDRCINEAIRSKAGDNQDMLLREVQQLDDQIASAPILTESRLLADDITPEFLATRMCQNGGRMGVLTSEGDLFDNMAGRYARGAANLGIFLKGHSGEEVRVDRGNRPSELIRNPTLTLGFCVQPDVLCGLIHQKTFRARGLIGRILFQIPESLLGRRNSNPPEIDTTIEKAYEDAMTALLKLNFGTGEDGQTKPRSLTLSTDAEARLLQFMMDVEEALGDFGDLATVSDWGGKLVGAVARIAGLLHVAKHIDRIVIPDQINADTMEEAISIGLYFRSHAVKAFSIMGRDESVAFAEHILKVIIKNGWKQFSTRDLYQIVRRRVGSPQELDSPLNRLIDHAYIRRVEQKKRSTPGRSPSEQFDVNPSVFENRP